MNKKNEYYQDENYEDKFNLLCVKCPYECKQSFRSTILACKYLHNKEVKKHEKK